MNSCNNCLAEYTTHYCE